MDHPAKGHAYLKSAEPKVQYNHGFAVMSTNSIWSRNMALVPGGLGVAAGVMFIYVFAGMTMDPIALW